MGRAKQQDKTEEGAVPAAPASSDITLDIVEHLQKSDNAHVTTMGENSSVIIRPKFLSTGLPSIDCILGGGLAAGRITELYSKGEGIGKSSLAAMFMCEMQRQGGHVILMDTEHGFTDERLRMFGVDPNKIVYVEPDHIEAACQVISGTIKYLKNKGQQNAKVLVVWDSLTGTQSKQSFEADYGDLQVASAARAYSQALLKLKDELAKSEIYVVLINQTRQNIGGSPFAEKHQTSGGMAVKYYAGVRLVMYRGANSWIKEGSQRLGFKVSMHTEKSRIAAPFKAADAVLLFDQGYDRWRSLFDLMVTVGLIEPAGARYNMVGLEKSFYMKDFEEALASLSDDEKESVINILREKGKLTDPVIEYFFPSD